MWPVSDVTVAMQINQSLAELTDSVTHSNMKSVAHAWYCPNRFLRANCCFGAVDVDTKVVRSVKILNACHPFLAIVELPCYQLQK